MQVISKKAMQTLYFNVHALDHNRAVRHLANGQMNRKTKEFYTKNPAMRAFLQGIERSDERYIQQVLKVIEFETKERIIRKDTWDRSILILAGGKITSFDDSLQGEVYTEGAILGVEQFLFN